jgi:hypothetical protein
MKKYDAKIFFSGYASKQVTARNSNEAVIKARKEVFESLGIIKAGTESYIPEIQEIVGTLEHWRDADVAEEVT